jgi:D-glycero-alpha-D-manno-heptose-7-phosphate kinase|tara:strand:+ start:162 stop:1139 length:978 start_codon:yes stop_codon:yes gene_type:complete
MIGTRTPFRMSFIGGGSDLKEFYSRTPGCVISTTINKYMYIFIHPFFDDRIQIKYSKTELVNRIEKIKHPIVRETLKRFDLKGIDINSIADLPAGTGLGSSSSYTVGLLHALYTYTNQNVSPELLARIACETEIEILKEPIGKQDQYAAAYGGLNLIRFFPDGKVKVESLKMKKKVFKQLQENLLLFYTGTTRSASDVLSDQKYNILNEQSKYDSLVRMTELVEKAYKQLCESNLEGFGKTLDENWQLKKSLSNKISNTDIDDIYSLAIKNGALGGKLLGAGGGGFLLFYCNKEHQAQLRNVLNNLKEIEFKFEMDGTKSIAFKA